MQRPKNYPGHPVLPQYAVISMYSNQCSCQLQPLATITSNSGNPGNLVTITSSISGGAGAGSVAEGAAALGSATAGAQTAGTAAALPAGSVYVARYYH